MGKVGCAVFECVPNKLDSRHRFPDPKKNIQLFLLWKQKIGNNLLKDITDDKIYSNYRVCSKHFCQKDFGPNNKLRTDTACPKFYLPDCDFVIGSAENEKAIEEEIERLSDDCNSQSIDLISNRSNNMSEYGIQKEIQQINNPLFALNTNFRLDDTVEIVPAVQQEKLESEISQESECTIVEEWNNKCITCLKGDVQMETLSSLSLLSEFKQLFKYLRIEEFRNEISLNSVCSNCVLQMHNMLSFKRQCEESSAKLRLFTTARISERVKSSTVIVEVLHKATQTEIEEKISSNSSVQTFLSVEKEPNKIAHNEIEEEFDLEEIDKKCVTCVNCNEKFNNESWLRRHQVLIHGLKNCIQECYDCLQLHFINYENKLRIHNECNHENICSVCDLKFKTIIHLAKHRLLHALTDIKEKLPFSYFDGRKSRRPCGQVACAQCGKFYKSANLLRSHIQRMHNANKVKIACTICTRSVYNLDEHLKRHQTHKFQQRTSVPRKKKVGFIEPRELCTYCGKLYARSSLRVHIMSVHLNIQNYECMYCDKMFASANIRTTHIKVAHLKLKRFPCDDCDKKFTTKSHAQKHKLIHTKERPFKCQHCDQLFRYSENIRRHMKQVHGVI